LGCIILSEIYLQKNNNAEENIMTPNEQNDSKEIENNLFISSLTEVEQNVFRCSFCNKDFSSKKYISNHLSRCEKVCEYIDVKLESYIKKCKNDFDKEIELRGISNIQKILENFCSKFCFDATKSEFQIFENDVDFITLKLSKIDTKGNAVVGLSKGLYPDIVKEISLGISDLLTRKLKEDLYEKYIKYMDQKNISLNEYDCFYRIKTRLLISCLNEGLKTKKTTIDLLGAYSHYSWETDVCYYLDYILRIAGFDGKLTPYTSYRNDVYKIHLSKLNLSSFYANNKEAIDFLHRSPKLFEKERQQINYERKILIKIDPISNIMQQDMEDAKNTIENLKMKIRQLEKDLEDRGVVVTKDFTENKTQESERKIVEEFLLNFLCIDDSIKFLEMDGRSSAKIMLSLIREYIACNSGVK